MSVDAEIERMIHQRTEEHQLREYLAKTEFKSLRDEALSLAEAGKTNLEEVLRVTASEQAFLEDGPERKRPPEEGRAS